MGRVCLDAQPLYPRTHRLQICEVVAVRVYDEEQLEAESPSSAGLQGPRSLPVVLSDCGRWSSATPRPCRCPSGAPKTAQI